MTRGTTPPIVIETDISLLDYGKVILTLKDSSGTIVDITNLTVTERTVSATLTQEQTLELRAGTITMQLRAVNAAGTAIASELISAHMSGVLNNEVISVV